jgi:hypothetical protein
MNEIPISDSGLGTKRTVQFEGIRSMGITNGFAQILFIVKQYDNEGNLLELADIQQNRIVISPLSDLNQVDPQTGITLQEGETGAPEFTWWWTMAMTVPLPTLIAQAIQILDSQGRFNRP